MLLSLHSVVYRPWHRRLLQDCQRLLDEEQFTVAVVYAYAACELATEQALGRWLKKHETPSVVQDAIMQLSTLRGDLSRPAPNVVYTALSGHKMNDEPFWSEFDQHRKRRHAIVHRGASCSRDEAEASVSVAAKYIECIASPLEASDGSGEAAQGDPVDSSSNS